MRLPTDSSSVIYLTPIPRLVVGVSGQRYYVKPNRIAVDVNAQDARAWIAGSQAREPSDYELATFDGHLSRV